ncbi:hypothetical protein [Dapis sp. BLCC M229]|uniref:hypothetical protein n=1 Tax=Dapis sp. BLCC M229 TaxID=3400188 RepID=UPI003CE9857C
MKIFIYYPLKNGGFKPKFFGEINIYDYKTYKKFSECVGWFLKAEWLLGYNLSEEDGLWLCYDDLNFTINAPKGHLRTAQDGEWLTTFTSKF